MNILSNKQIEEIALMWQVRHTIVHTARTVTHPDAQKVPALRLHAGKYLECDDVLITALARKLHFIVKDIHSRLQTDYLASLWPSLPSAERKIWEYRFSVSSPMGGTWL